MEAVLDGNETKKAALNRAAFIYFRKMTYFIS